MAEDDEIQEENEEEALPLLEKMAIVMVSLGEEVSGEVKHLTDYEIEEITQAIAGLKNISVDIMDRVLEEFVADIFESYRYQRRKIGAR